MQVIILAFGLLVAVRLAIALTGNPSVLPELLADPSQGGLIAIGAGLAIGLSGTGAGIGLGTAAAAAAAAITEKPESFGKLLVLLALIEAIAIYGFVIAFVLAGNIA
ncbi:MAG: hypothetical protein FK734_18210 [Asgard group archaeon]|nr:hypothetical protein [Asgard group archaeon]